MFRSPEPPSPVKAQLHFDLGDPEGERQLKLMLQAQDLMSVLRDMDNWLREKIKYGDQFKAPADALEATRYELRTQLQARNISLHE